MGVEIERKWMPDKIPEEINGIPGKDIIQGYLCTDPVVRIRKEGERYTLTYKGSGAVTREEYNLDLNKEAFAHLLPKCDGILIEKTRYRVDLSDKLTAEVDVFHGTYEGRIYVEVEFTSEEEAGEFCPPAWFGREVTGLEGYSNAALSGGKG